MIGFRIHEDRGTAAQGEIERSHLAVGHRQAEGFSIELACCIQVVHGERTEGRGCREHEHFSLLDPICVHCPQWHDCRTVSRGSSQVTIARDRYHHGGLREALLEAGLEMAREGGPDAVVLREATRRSSVSPNAAYRHFADRQALLDVVSATAQGMAADRMEEALASATMTGDRKGDARQELRAVGAGYLAFAREEPGLFRAAFTVPHDLTEATTPDKAGERGRTPFQILSDALDHLVDAGVLPAERRENAELHAWSSVHGLGMLIIDGPLRGFTDAMVETASQRLLDMVDRGL